MYLSEAATSRIYFRSAAFFASSSASEGTEAARCKDANETPSTIRQNFNENKFTTNNPFLPADAIGNGTEFQ